MRGACICEEEHNRSSSSGNRVKNGCRKASFLWLGLGLGLGSKIRIGNTLKYRLVTAATTTAGVYGQQGDLLQARAVRTTYISRYGISQRNVGHTITMLIFGIWYLHVFTEGGPWRYPHKGASMICLCKVQGRRWSGEACRCITDTQQYTAVHGDHGWMDPSDRSSTNCCAVI